MPQFVIERTLPGAGKLSEQDIQSIAGQSNSVLRDMTKQGTPIEWLHSYVTGDKVYCIYKAANEQAVREHARRGGFPADTVAEVTRVIDPSSAQPSGAMVSPLVR